MLLPRLALLLVSVLAPPTLSAAAPKPDSPAADQLQRETPRSAIREFLRTCHNGKFVRAAQYLDLSNIDKDERTIQGPELARELGMLLDRDMQFEVDQLADTPEGDNDDGLTGNLDRLASFPVDNRVITLHLERETHDGVSLWLVAPESVARIPELMANSEAPTLEKYMPRPLVEIKLLGTPVWAWLALILLALLVAVLSKVLSKLAVLIGRPFAKRYTPWLAGYRLTTLTDPLRLLLGVAVFRAALEAFAPSALLRDYLLSALALLTVAGAASVLMRLVDIISDQMISRLDLRDRSLSQSIIPLGVRFIKICIFGAGILVVLDQWGVRITTILAGVGVGGLAIALAAQKTIENLFGGISIITDRPVLVGDVCQFGGQTGTVADIGLRSTRLRTPERTIVTIPNAQFSTMTLENLSRRDRLLFKPVLQLRRDTTPAQIRSLMEALETLLREHPGVDPTDVPVRFVSIAPESFRLEVFSYILTTDANEFLRQQNALLLQILEMAEGLGVRFAVPFQESAVTESAPETAGRPQ